MIKKAFPILALSLFSSMLGVGIIAPLLPLYADKLGANGLWLGIIFGGFAFSRTIIMPFVGRLSDRKGRKLSLSIGLISYAIISLFYIWVENAPPASPCPPYPWCHQWHDYARSTNLHRGHHAAR